MIRNLLSELRPHVLGWIRDYVYRRGTTAGRPTPHAVGQMYFDTTLGIPIWYDGTNWIDAAGSTV